MCVQQAQDVSKLVHKCLPLANPVELVIQLSLLMHQRTWVQHHSILNAQLLIITKLRELSETVEVGSGFEVPAPHAYRVAVKGAWEELLDLLAVLGIQVKGISAPGLLEERVGGDVDVLVGGG